MSDRRTPNATDNLHPLLDVIAALNACEITPGRVLIEWPPSDLNNPDVSVRLRTRTDFETLTRTIGLRTDDAPRRPGQRAYWSLGNGPLIQCLSFEWQDDYLPCGGRR